MMKEKLPMRELGDVSATAISDGYLEVGFDLLANIDDTECKTIQQKACPNKLNSVHINAFLVRQQGKNILIDSGAGGIKGWGGELVNNLAKLNLKPTDISAVLLTHTHPDHIGGLITSDGQAVFSGAELLISQDEYNFIQDDKYFNSFNDRAKGNIIFARNVFEQYKSHLQIIEQGEVLPGIDAIPMKGHTPGHTGYRIEGSNGSLLIWGDIVHFPHIQLLKPNVSIAFDYDPKLAIETRLRVLDMVSSEHILVGGMHFGNDGFGYIKKNQTGYALL